ncbi:MAG: glycoside hydrolase family 3 C-terminal domain-containing protein [Lachnospiraceae bacterium]|nr:glycoside hydrolase family 3 C-terminal domain-containing protein [Lachnospiraceae bacterium]
MTRQEASNKAHALVEQMTTAEQASQLRFDAPAIPRLNIPAYTWWNEALHGVARAGTATVFPQAIAMAAMFDEDAMEQIGEAISIEARAKYNASSALDDRDIYKGLTFWSPNINIFRDPRWGRGQETYGEDPYLTARLGVRFVKGLQGKGDHLRVAACAKHFAVHSGPEALRHEFDAVVSKKDLYETYLPAFEALVKEADVEAVMGAYNRVNGEPCCGSNTLLRDILRGEWGFKGHVVSDCWAIRDFHEHHMVTNGPQESAKMALEAGCDCNCGCTYQSIMEGIQKKLIDASFVKESCERLFTTRFLLGMFDPCEYDEIPYETVECKEHVDLAINAARKSQVLLKNNGILPLNKKELKTIGVIGPNANSRIPLQGNYYGTSSRYITVLEGIHDAAGEDVRILYSEGCHLYKDRSEGLACECDRLSEAITVATHSDITILVLGLDETLEGEEMGLSNGVGSGDKADLLLPEPQRILLQTLIGTGKPLVIVLMAGSAIDLSQAEDHADAILLSWYPGARGGRAVADVLFGHISPAGKLPVTFYRNIDSLPEFTDYSMKGRTYRYMTEDALYPFGYGLTYGKCEVTDAALQNDPAVDSDLSLSVTVKNFGDTDTDEVVEVYIRNLDSPLAVDNYSLCGFKRIFLEAGESRTIDIVISNQAMTVVDEEGRRLHDGDHFILYAGISQPDRRSMGLTGTRPVGIEVNLR